MYIIDKSTLPLSLTYTQEETFIGNMLGDGYIKREGNFVFKQTTDHEEYVRHIHEIMIPFSYDVKSHRTKKPNNIDGKVINMDYWNGEWLMACRFATCITPFFKQYRKKWYPEGIKIVPRDISITPRTLAYWYCDDGSNKSIGKEITLSTNCFSLDDQNFLLDQLAKLSIKGTTQKAGRCRRIAISRRSYFDFIDLVKPYITWDCFQYKINTEKAPTGNEHMGAGKLNLDKADQIRRLYDTDKYTQKQLAKIYNVSVAIIWRIINNKIYKRHLPSFSGTAEAYVRYNYESQGVKHAHYE